jgi:two-component system NtrC family sensor kinase
MAFDRLFHDAHAFPILVVDDEVENLRVMDLTFRRNFKILTAESGEAALEILNTQPVAVILSDHRMPGMSGTQFLGYAKEIAPETVRILLTAYGDAETLGQAINDGSIYRYIPKPWDPDEMRLTLRRAIEHFATERERDGLLKELGTVNRIARTITQEHAPDRLNDLVLSSLTDDIGFDGASLFLYDEAEQKLVLERTRPHADAVADAIEGTEIPASGAPAFIGNVIRGETQSLEMAGVLECEAPVREWVTEVAAEQIVVVPVPGKDGLLGAIAVDNRCGSGTLDSSQCVLVEGVAAQVGIAIQNARRIEALRQSRLQIVRADRLGTLGTLAAGLAHEINNPLVSIHTFLSLAREKRNEDDEEFWGEYLDVAASEVERIRSLVLTMSHLGRVGRDDVPRAVCDLGEIVSGVSVLVEGEANASGVSVEIGPATEAPKVVAAREQIHQVVLNMMLNGIQACDEGGSVCVRFSTESCGERSFARIEIEDTGEGIPEENLERIFDPFFTTKDPDKGTGLGLMICHRVVTDHNGTIEVVSRPGEGTQFAIRLPVQASV